MKYENLSQWVCPSCGEDIYTKIINEEGELVEIQCEGCLDIFFIEEGI